MKLSFKKILLLITTVFITWLALPRSYKRMKFLATLDYIDYLKDYGIDKNIFEGPQIREHKGYLVFEWKTKNPYDSIKVMIYVSPLSFQHNQIELTGDESEWKSISH